MSSEVLLKNKANQPTNTLTIFIKYSLTLQNMILRKHWGNLKINKHHRQVFAEKLMIAYSRNKNLKNKVRINKIRKNNNPAGICLSKLNTKIKCKTCSKLKIKTPDRCLKK